MARGLGSGCESRTVTDIGWGLLSGCESKTVTDIDEGLSKCLCVEDCNQFAIYTLIRTDFSLTTHLRKLFQVYPFYKDRN